MANKIIRNDDYTVGHVYNTNQYDNDNAEAQKYRYIQLKYQNESEYKHGAKAADWKEISLSNQAAVSNTPAMFNLKLQEFFFSPPSDNLWDVKIEQSMILHDGDKTQNDKNSIKPHNGNLLQLYQDIKAVNNTWKNTHEESWGIDMSGAATKSKKTPEDFINDLCNTEIGVFLAQRVNFSPIGINFDGNTFGEAAQLGGFFKNAKIVKSRNDSDKLNISFLVSNWDIGEILIDPWIAAIAQYGLFVDGTINLKAKITVTEYSASHPKFSSEQKYSNVMEARKQYIFENCFPISRETPEKVYDLEEAGKFKNTVVNFVFDNYKINYFF